MTPKKDAKKKTKQPKASQKPTKRSKNKPEAKAGQPTTSGWHGNEFDGYSLAGLMKVPFSAAAGKRAVAYFKSGRAKRVWTALREMPR